jgi:hypothetical protein
MVFSREADSGYALRIHFKICALSAEGPVWLMLIWLMLN